MMQLRRWPELEDRTRHGAGAEIHEVRVDNGGVLFVGGFVVAVRGVVLEEDRYNPSTIYYLDPEERVVENNVTECDRRRWVVLRWGTLLGVDRTSRAIDNKLLTRLAQKVLGL